MHAPQHNFASNQTNPDVRVNNVGHCTHSVPRLFALRNGSTSMFGTMPSGSGTHLSSNIVMRGDWRRA
jgi:hypothetical protein